MSSEETLELPPTWARRLHPRRGGRPVPAVTVDADAPAAVASLVEGSDEQAALEAALASPDTPPEVAEAARRHLGGHPDPLGAAALASVLGTNAARHEFAELFERLADSWIAGHGLPFAACALTELSRLTFNPFGWKYHGRNSVSRSVAYLGPQKSPWGLWKARHVARKVRALLAVAADDEYEEAARRLAGRRGTVHQQAMSAYLVPDRHDWVEEACAAVPSDPVYHARWMVWCALGAPGQVGGAAARLAFWAPEVEADLLATMLDGVGAEILPVLVGALDRIESAGSRRLLHRAIGAVPADEAFAALVERIGEPDVPAAVAEAARRYPRRGMRVLALAAAGTAGDLTGGEPGGGAGGGAKGGARRGAKAAAELLHAHVPAHHQLVPEVLPSLPGPARGLLESVAEATERLPEARPEELPPVLASPPWTRRRKAARPTVVAGLEPPDLRSMSWAPGERDRWSADAQTARWGRPPREWSEQAGAFDTLPDYARGAVLVHAPEGEARPLLARWKPADTWSAPYWIRPVVARFGLDALPLALNVAEAAPAETGGALLPFLAPRAAVLNARWLARLKTARKHALAWFERHGVEAAPMLVPDALGRPGPDRVNAEGALRHIAARHGADAVVEAARRYGAEAGEAIAALLAADPLEVLPARIPKPPAWLDLPALPQVRLRDGDRALPTEATGHLVTMLALSKPGGVYPGVDIVREACDPASLAEFAWAIFRRWRTGGAPAKDGWALDQLGWLGDDETVRRLTPLIRAWPGEGAHARAARGLDVLAAIGTDVALMHLNGIAQKVRFKALKKRAQEMIREVAERLELTSEQLADRLVPGFGLDADGSMTLDYGPRRFVVGFDEQLKPYVVDEAGRRRKALPKPGAKDDDEKAAAAHRRFAALRKDVRTVAADQIRRLESAMVLGRRWPLAEFTGLFVRHPLVGHIVRRLLWAADHDGATTLFRVAEDRTFADVDDDALVLPDSAEIRLPHPALLDGGALAAWAEVFADYEIVQPFPQLGRVVHTMPEEGLAAFEKIKVPVGAVLGLRRSGWEHSAPEDAGIQPSISRPLGSGRHAVIGLDPGIVAGEPDVFPEQTITRVSISGDPYGSGTREKGDAGLDPVTASELLADLTALADAALP